MENMKGEIALAHWEACETCVHHTKTGCDVNYIDLEVKLGDFIICEDYQSNQDD